MNLICLFDSNPRNNCFNMAADLYFLNKCSLSNTIYLRFYQWCPPTITIGYSQKVNEHLRLEKLAQDGVSWIRRSTGGRAVFHKGDLTYSCIFSHDIKEMGSSISETYELITNCLINGLLQCGIECESHDSSQDLLNVKRQIKLPCFVTPNRNEVMINGKKLVGSAQKRTIQGVLQHGSIPFTDEYLDLVDYLEITNDERLTHRKLLEQKSISICKLGKNLDKRFVAEKISFAFGEMLSTPYNGLEPIKSEDVENINTIATSDEFLKQWCS